MRSISAPFGSIRAASQNRRAWNFPFDSRAIVTGSWVFLGYYLGSKIGFALTFKPHPVSVLWPPNSILVAALLLTPPRIWWFVLLCALPAHCAAQLQSHVPPLMILCWFISNSSEALIGAGLARYLVGGPIRFNSLRNAGIFLACIVFIGPFLSSFLDAAFVVWNNWGQGSYGDLTRVRFSSNVLTALTVAPLIVTWVTQGIPRLRRVRLSRFLEACILILGLSCISFVVLHKFPSAADPALLFLPLPLLLWAAVRFGSLGATTAISIVSFLAIRSGTHGHGPFSGGTAEQNARSIQIFLIALAIPLFLLGAVIEERAARETELHESESRFRIVADVAPVLIWMSGTDKLCTFFNKPWLEFTGRSMEQEAGKGWVEGVHPDDLQNCFNIYTEAFNARQPFIMQYRLRRTDGEYRFVSDHGVPRYDAQGRFAGYIGSAIDVTELVNKDAALRESEERMRLAADAANLGIWEWDLEKDEISATTARQALLGWPASGKIRFKEFLLRLHEDDRKRIEEIVSVAIRDGKGYDSEYRVVLPDGTLRWMAIRGSMHFANGKPTKFFGISIDITDRKQADLEARQRREDLSHLSRAALMTEMSASLAHELNQPLAGIISNASAGQRFIDAGNVDLKEMRELLADISADGHRAGEVLRGIRNMVKKEKTQRRRIELNDVITKVVQMVGTDALLHSCEVRMSLEPNLPMVEADTVQVQQVLLNLIVNAFDAMRHVPTAKRKVEISTKCKGKEAIETSVRDYGIGISKEASERLFEQFYTTKSEGLGMGLAIVRSIVESHDGAIIGENADGGGARFSFTLPITASLL